MDLIYTILMILLLLTGCGHEDRKPDIDPVFQPMVDAYLAAAPGPGDFWRLQSVKYKDFSLDEARAIGGDELTIGLCSRDGRVEIKPNTVDGYTLEALVMHELGHCIHGFKHANEQWALMGPNVRYYGPQAEAYWRESLNQRLQEMFHQ